MEKCIDLSYWQGNVDFSQVKKSVDCVILREGYGTIIDKKFLEYVKGATAAGLKIHGVYHFIYSLSSADAKKEAQAAIANLQKAGLPKTTRIWCDLEYDTVKKAKTKGVTIGKNEVNLFTITFCQAIEAAGYPTGIYTNIDYYKNYYTQDTLSKYPIWLADYSGGADYECLVHQYSSSGTVLGISTKVDMNYCYITDDTDESASETATGTKSYLSEDDSGDAVKTMQSMLIACGFSCGKSGADGQFGADTYTALVSFQMFCGITQDGKYGTQSKAKLETLYASAKASTETPVYTVGKSYTLQNEMRVRFGAGVTYVAKTHAQLTTDGQKHDTDKDGCLDKGTVITCKEIKQVGNDIWIRCPSGWLAAYYNGKVYIK
jgi:GH25 family lysozyme M1 (1,4-beta-N-acetylmuramidase)